MASFVKRAVIQVTWMMVIVLTIFYVVAIFLVQIATEHRSVVVAADVSYGIKKYFGSLFETIYYLFQALTDGIHWGLLADSIMEVSWIYAVALLLCMCFIMLVVLNIITSIFVHAVI